MTTFSGRGDVVALAERPNQSSTDTRRLRETFLDPIAPDDPSDPMTTLTERQLMRLIFLAGETGVRFEREGIPHESATWMITPRQLFHGESALMACRHQQNFVRAIILHGLSLGLDADPVEIDELMDKPDAPTRAQSHSVGRRGPALRKCPSAKGSLRVTKAPA